MGGSNVECAAEGGNVRERSQNSVKGSGEELQKERVGAKRAGFQFGELLFVFLSYMQTVA